MIATDVTRVWDEMITEWQRAGVRYRYPSGTTPEEGIDCWHGGILIPYRAVRIDLPDYVTGAQERTGRQSLGTSGLGLYAGLFERSAAPHRVGDVLFFVSRKRTHVATCLDSLRALHIGEEIGITRPLIADLCARNSVLTYRYIGPGREVFDGG